VNKTGPLVSVIVGVNRDDGTLLQSIKSILNQTYSHFELIIINDGSSEKVKIVIEDIIDERIVLINSTKIGLTPALNIALKESKGKYIARHDAGDFSLKDRFFEQIEFLEKNTTVSICGTWIKETSSSGVDLGITSFPVSDSEIKNNILYQNVFCHGSIMAKKDDIIQLNGYREEFKHSQDYDLWLRLIESFEVANLEKPLYVRIISPNSISFVNKEKQKAYADLARDCYYARKAKAKEPLYRFESINRAQNKIKNQNRIHSSYKFYCGRRLYSYGNMRLARKYFFNSLSVFPFALKNIIYILITLLPQNLRMFFEKIWLRKKAKYNLRID
tara:strand:+ start:992 stop:1984 length:993 start_codon:yes stop_codon:yes gene_type:complete